MAQKPGFAQNTGILRLSDAIIFDRNTDIVTDASAEGTDCMIYLHRDFPVQDFPFLVEAAEPAKGDEERLTGIISTCKCLESGMPEAQVSPPTS